MADNVQIDPGTTPSVTVSTDDAGASGHVQRVKLALSADGSAAHATVDADGVLVNLGANNDVTVTGTVTATGAALESGGNLAAAATSLAVVDDWDESDRAKVNPIVGQAGIAAGAGAVGVTVPRVTLASDDPAVALLGTIDADTGAIAGHVDGIETLIGTTNTTLSTIDGRVDGVEALLGTIDADTSTLAGAVVGNEMQVDVVAALPAGTNNIGDVDVATLPGSSSSTDIAVNSSATSVQVIAANAARKGLILTNTDANGVYIYFGTTATATKFTVHLPGTASLASGTYASYEMPAGSLYTGRIDAIWSADGSGALIGSEL